VCYSSSKETKSIVWKQPLAGDYKIRVRLADAHVQTSGPSAFRLVLAGQDQKPVEVMGTMTEGVVECFRFVVTDSGAIRSCQLLQEEAESEVASTKAPSEADFVLC